MAVAASIFGVRQRGARRQHRRIVDRREGNGAGHRRARRGRAIVGQPGHRARRSGRGSRGVPIGYRPQRRRKSASVSAPVKVRMPVAAVKIPVMFGLVGESQQVLGYSGSWR